MNYLSNALLAGTMSDSELNGMYGMLIVVVLVMAAVGLILYIVQGIGLSKIARNQGYDKPWFAWIPILNGILPVILVEDEAHEQIQGKLTLIYILSVVVSMVLSMFIPFITIVPYIVMYYAFYLMAAKYSDRPVLHLIVAIVTCGLSMPFQYVRFGNREDLA